MNKAILTALSILCVLMGRATDTGLDPAVKGVWANASSELVQTDSVLIYFTRDDSRSTKSATLIIPSRHVNRTTVFTPDTILMSEGEAPDIKVNGTSITVDGAPMQLVETIHTVKPYKMLQASDSTVADCLQQWQLGVRVMLEGEYCHVMIDTNRHSFMYMVVPQMSYIRAASLRHTPKGSVFLQNIRMMRNMNTGEYTHYSAPDNYALLTDLPAIDTTKFVPGSCTFTDEGIYWSLVSVAPGRITLNGCGEEYIYEPSDENAGIMEWVEFDR